MICIKCKHPPSGNLVFFTVIHCYDPQNLDYYVQNIPLQNICGINLNL